MTISIVVPAFNEARGLPATLVSIRRAAVAFDARGWHHSRPFLSIARKYNLIDHVTSKRISPDRLEFRQQPGFVIYV